VVLNSSSVVVLSILAFIGAVLTIRAEYRGPRWHVYVFKPLTTACLLVVAILPSTPVEPTYQRWVVAGLIFSLAGDVFLMLPSDRFTAGLVSFLAAHLCYISAFATPVDTRGLVWFVPFAAFGVVMYRVLRPGLQRLRMPVAAYIVVIIVMAWQALLRSNILRESHAVLAAAGAMLFLVSDGVLAVNRFRVGFRFAHVMILGTYFAAQWCIALSVTP
jgi:uncharacterized membrane protein YhhN